MNRSRILLLAVVVAAFALLPLVLGNFGVSLLNDIGISALVALGLVLLTGVGFEPPVQQPVWGALREPATDGPRIGILFYRAQYTAGNTAYVEALADAIDAAGGAGHEGCRPCRPRGDDDRRGAVR